MVTLLLSLFLFGEADMNISEIQDDQFIHCLKLLHDRDSGGVRMQASVAKGDLKR